jgi:Glycosyl transferase family 2
VSPHSPGVIAVITGGTIRHTMVAQCLARLQSPPGTRIEWIAGDTNIAANRNYACEALLATDGAWLWMLDDDQLFASDCLSRLLAHLQDPRVDLVVPLVLRRRPPHASTLSAIVEGGDHFTLRTRPVESHEHGLTAVDACGAGGLLIRRRVLERLSRPWFELGRVRSDQLQEDTWFCHKARQAGCRAFCDLETPMGHVAQFAVWPRHRTENGHSVRDIAYQFVRGAIGPLEEIEEAAAADRRANQEQETC